MIVDCVRLVSEWLADDATGLNAQLANVPRDPGENPPDAVTLYNRNDDDWVGRGEISDDVLNQPDANGEPTPVMVTTILPDEKGIVAQALSEYWQKDPTIIPVAVIFMRRKIERTTSIVTVQSQVRDATQTIRAAFRVIAQQFESSLTTITRNGCEISLPSSGIVLNSNFLDVGDDVVKETLVVGLRVLDRWALAITPT